MPPILALFDAHRPSEERLRRARHIDVHDQAYDRHTPCRARRSSSSAGTIQSCHVRQALLQGEGLRLNASSCAARPSDKYRGGATTTSRVVDQTPLCLALAGEAQDDAGSAQSIGGRWGPECCDRSNQRGVGYSMSLSGRNSSAAEAGLKDGARPGSGHRSYWHLGSGFSVGQHSSKRDSNSLCLVSATLAAGNA
jgi:hypothetical protein